MASTTEVKGGQPKLVTEAELYRQIVCSFVSIADGALVKSSGASNALDVVLFETQMDVEAGENRTVQRTFRATSTSESTPSLSLTSPFAVEPKPTVKTSYSPSGRRVAVFRKDPKADEKAKKSSIGCFIEIWEDGRLAHIVKTQGKHGLVYSDDIFGNVTWSADETKLVYAAEKYDDPKKRPSFWEHNSNVLNSKADTASAPSTPATPVSQRSDIDASSRQPQSLLQLKQEEGAPGSANEFVEDWGETFVGFSLPRLFCVDYAARRVFPVPGIPDKFASGNPQWVPGRGVYFVGYDTSVRRLGVRFCFNRESAVYHVPFDGSEPIVEKEDKDKEKDKEEKEEKVKQDEKKKEEKVLFSKVSSDCDLSVHSPRVTPDNKRLVYFGYTTIATHNGNARLRLVDISGAAEAPLEKAAPVAHPQPRTVVDVIDVPSSPTAFTGFSFRRYPTQHPWLGENYLVVSSPWRSHRKLVAVDISEVPEKLVGTGEERVHVISLGQIAPPADQAFKGADAEQYAWEVFDIKDGVLLTTVSTPSRPPVAVLGTFNPKSKTPEIQWQFFPGFATAEAYRQKNSDNLTWKVLEIAPTTNNGDNASAGAKLPFESIFLSLSENDKEGAKELSDSKKLRPLVVVPHGGPHGAYAAEFVATYLFFAHIGFDVLLVNYRGSTAFGQSALNTLPGNCGTQDVADTMDSINYVIANKLSDESRIAVMGGSHGGFLTAHLVSRFNIFKAGVAFNPVINITTMAGTTDISDWCFVEAGGLDKHGRTLSLISPETLAAMTAASPIIHAKNCTTPTLIVIGLADKRVPPAQGMEFYWALKARGTDTRVLVYEDNNHAIAAVNAASDSWINAALWLKHYTF